MRLARWSSVVRPRMLGTVLTVFNREELETAGFGGFVRLSEVGGRGVPKDSGVYVVLREPTTSPRFIARSPVGHPDGRDMSVDEATLAARWVTGCPVVYIGKA